MSIFDDIKAKGAAYRLTQESLYAEALREIESGQRRDGIWAKALAESDMDQGKAGARYIKLRVQSLKDEVTLFIADMKKADQAIQTARISQKAMPTQEPAIPIPPLSALGGVAWGIVTGIVSFFMFDLFSLFTTGGKSQFDFNGTTLLGFVVLGAVVGLILIRGR